jgi:hypothetical protein
MFFSKPVLELPKINAPTAAEICAKCNPSAQAKALLTPDMTPAQYMAALDKNKLPLDSVNFMANGLPEKDSVCWATQSANMTAPKLSAPEMNALSATQAYLKNPTPALRDAIGASLGKVDFTGPGSWAAQAAAWSKMPGAPAIPGAAAAAGAAAAPANLVAAAVSGAIMLAAGLMNGPAMPPVPNLKPPVPMTPLSPEMLQQLQLQAMAGVPKIPAVPVVDQAKLVKPLQPFIDMGKKVATGSVSCA